MGIQFVMPLRAACAATLTTLIAVGLASAAPGHLDPTFSGDGWARTRDFFGYFQEYMPKGAEDVAIQHDGKIVATGELESGYESYFGAFRYTANGDLDRGFGEGGWVDTDVGSVEHPHAVAIQGDGKIVLAGSGFFNVTPCTVIVRYQVSGELDRSFGGNGIVRTCRRNSPGAEDVLVQPDGKIVTVSAHHHYRPFHDFTLFLVARYLPDGRQDRTFSGDGTAEIGLRAGQYPRAALLQRDAKILVAGSGGQYSSTTSDFVLARLNRNGTPDRSFSGDGLRTVDIRGRVDGASALAVQRNGRIVVAGTTGISRYPWDPRIAVVRLLRNGAVDRTFGKRVLKPAANGGNARAVVVQPDGGILVAGRAYDDRKQDTSAWALVRYLPNGRVDRSFGKGGIVLGDFGTGADWAGAMVLQPDGKIVVAGSVYEDQAVARFLPR
ncbi:MAG TPA: hypothetical protein VFL41_07410 [Gaiellaceae bacterium]|nr:hypothetical protein [Gaiellaceae bacterium]